MPIASVADYRLAARRRLPRFLFDYIDGGSYDEVTLAANIADMAAVRLRQRVLIDVGTIDTATDLLGFRSAMPVGLGPVGMGGFYARRGEVQAARAAVRAGVPFSLSTLAACSLEEVTHGCGRAIWFQFYMVRDRGFTREMLARAEASGASALLFTVDLPVPGTRYRDERSGQSGTKSLARSWTRFKAMATRPGWCWDVGVRGRPHTLGNLAAAIGTTTGLDDYWAWVGRNFDPTVSWDDLDDIRARWKGKLVLKGVLDPEDARRAAAAGVDGIVVSNHGGRQLDGATSTIAALPAIADALGGRLTILLDGGVRSGLDVVRALASGADGVLLGRAWAYALAARGEAGVAHMLALIRAELLAAMAMTGCVRVADIDGRVLIGAEGLAAERRRAISLAVSN